MVKVSLSKRLKEWPTKIKKPYLRLVTKELLEQLTESDRQDFQKRYGADLSESASLEEIAKQFDITKQRIREIEAKALESSKITQTTKGLKVRKSLNKLRHNRTCALRVFAER